MMITINRESHGNPNICQKNMIDDDTIWFSFITSATHSHALKWNICIWKWSEIAIAILQMQFLCF